MCRCASLLPVHWCCHPQPAFHLPFNHLPTDEPFLELVVPASINKYLRSYQRDGIRFLFRYGIGPCMHRVLSFAGIMRLAFCSHKACLLRKQDGIDSPKPPVNHPRRCPAAKQQCKASLTLNPNPTCCRQYARGTGGVLADDMGLGEALCCYHCRCRCRCCCSAAAAAAAAVATAAAVAAAAAAAAAAIAPFSCLSLVLTIAVCALLQAKPSRPLALFRRCWARLVVRKTPVSPSCRSVWMTTPVGFGVFQVLRSITIFGNRQLP